MRPCTAEERFEEGETGGGQKVEGKEVKIRSESTEEGDKKKE